VLRCNLLLRYYWSCLRRQCDSTSHRFRWRMQRLPCHSHLCNFRPWRGWSQQRFPRVSIWHLRCFTQTSLWMSCPPRWITYYAQHERRLRQPQSWQWYSRKSFFGLQARETKCQSSTYSERHFRGMKSYLKICSLRSKHYCWTQVQMIYLLALTPRRAEESPMECPGTWWAAL